MSQAEKWTIKRLLEWTADFLKRHGSDAARLEAEILLAYALQCKRIELYTSFEMEPPEDKRTIFRELVKRRSNGEPVAYLTGSREFFSAEFKVTPDVLIPRPETELLVIEALELVKKSGADRSWRICDLGTGSGNIAIALAKNRSNIEVTAIDRSAKALAVAQLNAEKNKVAERIHFLESDLFTALDKSNPFDIIVSNPPYVSAAEYRTLAPMVRNFEPKEALLAGETGCEIIEQIIQDAPSFLISGGHIFLEASPMIINRIPPLFEKGNCWKDIRTIKDFSRLERFATAVKQ